MSIPEVRAYRAGDEVAINDAFNRVFGAQRSLAEWTWKFSQPGALEATLAAWDGEALAAHNGAIPAVYQVAGKRVKALQGVDTFSLAAIDRRRDWKSAWRDVMDAFAEYAARRAGASLLFGFTGPRSISHMVARCQWNGAPPRRIPLLERKTRSVRRTLASSLYTAKLAGDDEAALDDLWARVARRYPTAVVRDAKHSRHRFSGHPGVQYHRWLVYRRFSSKPVAWVVFRTDGGVCSWADLLWGRRASGRPGPHRPSRDPDRRSDRGCSRGSLVGWRPGGGGSAAQPWVRRRPGSERGGSGHTPARPESELCVLFAWHGLYDDGGRGPRLTEPQETAIAVTPCFR